MKSKKKIVSFIILIITILGQFCPIFQTVVEAATYVVDYRGSVTYGLSKVGRFYVNGQQAFCMDHDKSTPPSGTSVEEGIYNDDNILKCLYYGWGGDAQWNFISEAQGIVYTTLAIDHFKNGNSNNTARDFINYVNSMPVPNIVLNFSQNKLNAYLDGNTQRTQSISVNGNTNYYLTISLPNGVSLVNETRGTTNTGNVNVYGGDTFYLRAPLTVSGSWTSNNIDNHKYKYQPIIYRTTNSRYQDLAGRYRVVEDPTSTINLTVDWLSTGGLRIHKVDETTGEAISNTTFDLKNSSGTIVKTITTDKNGYAEATNLVAGTYTLVEKSANNKYILDNTTKEIVISTGETKTIELTNKHKEGSLKIVKVDSRDNKTPVPNVTFEIWSVESNRKIGTEKTDSNGTITVNNLRIGQYKVKEVATNEWYILDSKERAVTIEWNKTSTITIGNEIKTGYIEIIKEDEDYSDIKLENVRFEIRDEDGNLVDTLITNKEGYAKSKALALDKKYTVKETEKVANYKLSTEIKNVTFIPADEGETKQLVFTNKHEEGSLQIIKVDSRDNKTPIPNVTFEIWNVELNKKIATKTTGEDGIITINNLRTGEYRVKEVATNEWYVLDTSEKTTIIECDKTTYMTIENDVKEGYIEIIKTDADYENIKLENVKFEIRDEKGNLVDTLITNKEGYAKSKALPIDKKYTVRETNAHFDYVLNSKDIEVSFESSGEDIVLNITNEHKEGNVKVYKVDKDNKKITIGGVEFALYSYEFDKITGYYKTDVNGEIYIENLRTGDYALIEQNTNKWYNLNDNPIDIEVQWSETANITVENELKKSQIRVIKVDKDDNEIKLANVEFEVLDEDGNVLETIKTNQNGEAITSRYPVRDFERLFLRETVTNEKYVLDDEIYTVELKENEIIDYVFENQKIQGQIKIIKTAEEDNKINGDEEGTPIPNVSFGVYDENKNFVEKVTTDETGMAITSKLEKGIYYIKELEGETGEWYQLNENEYSAEIIKHGEIIELNITNKPDNPDINVEKEGIIQTTANQEIKYDFKIQNIGNVALDNFTWHDFLPTDYVTVTKLVTGTYNQDLNYAIYYKTNKNEYRLLRDNLSTQINNYIDFSNLELEEDEYVTEFKAEFGTVDVGFTSVENPQLFVKVKSTVQNEDTFTNETKVGGYHKTYYVWDEDEHTTEIYEKKIEVKKLPRTGC